jgi:DNA-binding NtrC family response regulator
VTADAATGLWSTQRADGVPALHVRTVRLEVVQGPDAGLVCELTQPRVRIGRTGGNDVVLHDRKVSGLHAELVLDDRGFRLRDLGSTNGVFAGGVQVLDGYLAPGAVLSMGQSQLRFQPLAAGATVDLDDGAGFPGIVGGSLPMRRLFALLRRIAATDATCLVTGETGTGKEAIAEAIHRASPRASGPFVVADCGAIPASLFEAEIFGHEKGAYTGAMTAAPGLFERAHGGTLFLDEIGELPFDLQPKLLRAVQNREIRRVGGTRPIPCDVRLIAATHRNLAIEINRGAFREDLYFRLAVTELHVPPLRERMEDVPALVDHFVAALGAPGATVRPAALQAMMGHAWPGNVRELRNAVERALVLPDAPPAQLAVHAAAERLHLEVDTTLPFREAKQILIDEFDRRLIETLLARHDGNIAEAARATGLDRVSVYKIMNRLGMRRDRDR